jgi:hypothetical protein
VSIKARLKALEIIANPEKPWFCIDVVDEPTAQEWDQIKAAHIDGRIVYLFKQNATLGIWLVRANVIYWSDSKWLT